MVAKHIIQISNIVQRCQLVMKKKQEIFSNPKKEGVITVMKDTYPKKKFKPHWMGLLKNPDFRIYPEIWHFWLYTMSCSCINQIKSL